MLPVIALVGRPNVGKSTLFNRLTRTRDALVADFPGLTRDRQYGIGRVGPARYVVVDTGGISGGDGVEALMERQVQQAIDEADHLLFLLDAHDGVTAGDLDIAAALRRTGKPLTAVVNKIDHLAEDLAGAEFHSLGLGEPRLIAAAQGRGVKALMDRVCKLLPPAAEAAGEADEDRVRIAVVGRPNAGKSTLINRILGEERVVTFDSPGTTRDSVSIPFDLGERRYTLIDTAGVRRRARVTDAVEKFSVIKTLQAIEACNVVILVLDARLGIGEQDATLAGHVVEAGRALVVAVNKWDGLDPEQRSRINDDYRRRLGFLDFAAVHRISALHGSGVGLLLDAADSAYANAMRDLPTPLLTRLLEQAVQAHQPPLVRGRRIKLRYAHQGGRNPPIIVIHGNQTDALPAAYRRYLVNRFRGALDLAGTPLRLELRSGENPYEGRRNPLTARQVRKRQRLKDFVRRKG
ncbi:MAG: ribosome biogenesis GTPase Der [Thiohalocapsa sp.]|uniref:ribosome biogenesis GTPase Der n=1 Tax=Thiohalocapsa sp. TaxID=2497641 RepID=UPI0025F4FE1D|nr:ribosome biogenesis GTPase Der [Thiohalocapsa sp.]MCG6940747.1 ribosome biogenesis GTPase Der [Thiohalocapsa sp.]